MKPTDLPNRSRRQRAATALAKPGIKSVARRLPGWHGVLVLNYHRIGDHMTYLWDHALWSASAESLDSQLAMLARQAEVIDPGEVEAAQRSRHRGRRVLLTFDDGYRDNFELAYPLLRQHGLTATFFLATGFLDRPHVAWWDELAWMVHSGRSDALPPSDWLPSVLSLEPTAHDATIAALIAHYKTLPSDRTNAFLDYVASTTGSGRCDTDEANTLWMTWEMAREMHSGGMTIGGHTVTHPVLARIPLERQELEISGCAQRLEDELGEPMRWFAYPVGARDTFTVDTQQILHRQGVELAFSFYGGCASLSRWDPLDVPRVHVGREHGPDLVQAMVWIPRLFAR